MQISTIASIQPNGEPYQSQYGLLYPFIVSFQDNTQGTVNTKTAQPPYKVGDRVGYEVTGDFRGVSKLKISKNPDKAFGSPAPQVQPPYQAPAPVAGRPAGASEIEAINPVFGATVEPRLMAMSKLYFACVAHARKTLNGTGLPDDPETVRQIATAFFIQSTKEGLHQ